MAHIHEKIDFTASAYVVFRDKVLLHLHKKAGVWLPPGGHIELNEGLIEAALREVKEEAGLDVELVGNPRANLHDGGEGGDILPPKFLNRHYFDSTKSHEHIDFVYFGRTKSVEFHPEEGVEMRWVSRKEIEEGVLPLKNAIRAYALAALDELGK